MQREMFFLFKIHRNSVPPFFMCLSLFSMKDNGYPD